MIFNRENHFSKVNVNKLTLPLLKSDHTKKLIQSYLLLHTIQLFFFNHFFVKNYIQLEIVLFAIYKM